MPITIALPGNEPKAHPEIQRATSIDQFLQRSCPDSFVPNETHVYASSFIEGYGGSAVYPCAPKKATSASQEHGGVPLYPSSSSFIRSAIEAWGRHSHLVLRPDDVWFSILVQMNFYMRKNAASIRDLFVAHDGKKALRISNTHWHEIFAGFRAELQKNIKTSWMSDWISPGFSTSTVDDENTATVLMMGLMKSFFDYDSGEICGIPSITLLGTKRDWQRLLKKIDRLDQFGAEPEHYADRLRPILSRIVRSFDNPSSTDTRDFWNQIVQAKIKHGICGEPPVQYIVSGWILGFFYWDSTGDVNRTLSQGSGPVGKRWEQHSLEYDGVRYGKTALEDLPVGYAQANFTMMHQKGGDDFDGWVLAGSIGKSIVDGAPAGYTAALDSQDDSWHSEKTDDSNEDTGCLSALLGGLNCFRMRHLDRSTENVAKTVHGINEKEAVVQSAETLIIPGSHSTIQPRSGWFVFGPNRDTGPFFDSEEIDGPTVDAIVSCGDTARH